MTDSFEIGQTDVIHQISTLMAYVNYIIMEVVVTF